METASRIKITQVSFLIFTLLLLGRLFYWQVMAANKLAVAAARQHLDYLRISAQRGQILASDGFPLVANEEVFLVFGLPADFQEKKEIIARKLSSLLAETQDEEEQENELLIKEISFKEKLDRPNLLWVPLLNKISREVKERIEDLDIAGIGFESQSRRTYPEGTASAHLLGFVGSDLQGQDKGYFGLEGFYDLELRGRPGLLRREKDASGKPILVGGSYEEEKRDGRNLLTTIDRTVQFIVAKNLQKGIERYGAVSGSVVVMDPKDGAVLSMVHLPTYDPITYSKFEEALFANPVVASSFEPGSTFKVLVMAAAINETVVEPKTICDLCSGPRKISGFTIDTWNNEHYPDSTVTDILVHSDNVGMVFVGEKLGKEKLYQYLRRFGFGQLTGIDLQDEGTPPLRPQDEWREIDLATASFGQGVAVTPIQMIRAVTVIASGGKLVRPHLVKGIYDQGELTLLGPEEGKPVIKPSSAKIINQMMVEAVERGEAKWAKPAGFKIAGKTGTAQIPVAGHYDEEKTIASFVGFAPSNKPKFVMLVTLREPETSPWGSETAAPLWFEIAKELFTYFGIMPE